MKDSWPETIDWIECGSGDVELTPPPLDPERVALWHFTPVENARVASRPFLCRVLSACLGVSPREVPLTKTSYGKPILSPGHSLRELQFSLSHSAGHLVIAVTAQPLVGVDIENIRPNTKALDIASRFFSPAEADWLKSQNSQHQHELFYQLWVAKEAVVKALGKGLAHDLNAVELAESQPGSIQLIATPPGTPPPGDWELHHFRLKDQRAIGALAVSRN